MLKTHAFAWSSSLQINLGYICSLQEKLAVAAREIEDQMEEYDFGSDDENDDDDDENPFGDREEATGLLADVWLVKIDGFGFPFAVPPEKRQKKSERGRVRISVGFIEKRCFCFCFMLVAHILP